MSLLSMLNMQEQAPQFWERRVGRSLRRLCLYLALELGYRCLGCQGGAFGSCGVLR